MQRCCCDGIHILLEAEVDRGAEQLTFEKEVRTAVKDACGGTGDDQRVVIRSRRFHVVVRTSEETMHLNNDDCTLHRCGV
jgi:hypothetical protein